METSWYERAALNTVIGVGVIVALWCPLHRVLDWRFPAKTRKLGVVSQVFFRMSHLLSIFFRREEYLLCHMPKNRQANLKTEAHIL